MAQVVAPAAADTKKVGGTDRRSTKAVDFERDGDSVIVWCEAMAALSVDATRLELGNGFRYGTGTPFRASINRSFNPEHSPPIPPQNNRMEI